MAITTTFTSSSPTFNDDDSGRGGYNTPLNFGRGGYNSPVSSHLSPLTSNYGPEEPEDGRGGYNRSGKGKGNMVTRRGEDEDDSGRGGYN